MKCSNFHFNGIEWMLYFFTKKPLTFKIQYSEFNIYKATYLNHVNGSFETFNIKEIEYYSKNMFFYRKSIYLT